MHCGNVWRWYNYTFVAFPRDVAIKPKQSLRATLFWRGSSSLKLNPFSVTRTVFFFFFCWSYAWLNKSSVQSIFTRLQTYVLHHVAGTLLCCHIGALVGVLNENVAGKNRSASFLAADVPNEENVPESSPFRTVAILLFFLRLMVQPNRWVTEILTDPGKLQTACF